MLKVAFPKSDKSTGFGKMLKKKLLRSDRVKKKVWSFMKKPDEYDQENSGEKVKGSIKWDSKTAGVAGTSAKPQRLQNRVKLVPLEMGIEGSSTEIDTTNEFATTTIGANTTTKTASHSSTSRHGVPSQPQYLENSNNPKNYSKPLRRGSARLGATVSFGEALVDFGDDDDDDKEFGFAKNTRALPSVAVLPANAPSGGKNDRTNGVAGHLPGQALEQQLGNEEGGDDDDDDDDDDAFVREYAADLVEDTSLPMGQKLLELAGLREKGDLSARDFAAAKAYLLKVTADGRKHDGGVDRLLNDATLTFAMKLEKLANLREERKVTPKDFAIAKATLLQRERTKPRTKELAYLNDVIEDPELTVTHVY